MEDITKHYRFQKILQEAAAFRTLRELFDALPGQRGNNRVTVKRDEPKGESE